MLPTRKGGRRGGGGAEMHRRGLQRSTDISCTAHMDSTKDTDGPEVYDKHTTQTSGTHTVCVADVPAGRQTSKPGGFGVPSEFQMVVGCECGGGSHVSGVSGLRGPPPEQLFTCCLGWTKAQAFGAADRPGNLRRP